MRPKKVKFESKAVVELDLDSFPNSQVNCVSTTLFFKTFHFTAGGGHFNSSKML